MPSAPQIIAALLLGFTFGTLTWMATYRITRAIQQYGLRNAGRAVAKDAGQILMNLFTTLIWIALLAWGGFWS